MKRFALIATILVAAAGCDKTKAMLGLGRPREPDGPPPEARLDLTKRPNVVFQLFGERDDPRMIPLCAIVDGVLKPIELTSSGWHEFDAMYTRSNKTLPALPDGAEIGQVHVRRGMWERARRAALFLPGCRLVTPLSAVSLETDSRLSFTVEALAATPGVVVRPKDAREGREGLDVRARRVGARRGARRGNRQRPRSGRRRSTSSRSTRARRSRRHSWHRFSTPNRPIATDRRLTSSSSPTTPAAATSPTFRHTASGLVGTAQFRRYIDHLDINGDGIDEIVLEGWQFAGETFISVLGYANGEWSEVFRGRSSWCLSKRNTPPNNERAGVPAGPRAPA